MAGLHRAVCHSQLPSLSRQNIRWMLHPDTLPVAAGAGQCYSYIIIADRTEERRNVRRAWWCVWGCGGRRDGQTRVRAR